MTRMRIFMQRFDDNLNADQDTRMLDLLPELGDASFGSAMLRLAHAAAALHRAEGVAQGAEPWRGLSVIQVSTKDKAEHGSSPKTRSARDRGPVTTEGNR